jgi:hypothetical protein
VSPSNIMVSTRRHEMLAELVPRGVTTCLDNAAVRRPLHCALRCPALLWLCSFQASRCLGYECRRCVGSKNCALRQCGGAWEGSAARNAVYPWALLDLLGPSHTRRKPVRCQSPPTPPSAQLQVCRQCRVVLLLCQRVQLPAVAEAVAGKLRRRCLLVSFIPGVPSTSLQKLFKFPSLEVVRVRVVRRLRRCGFSPVHRPYQRFSLLCAASASWLSCGVNVCKVFVRGGGAPGCGCGSPPTGHEVPDEEAGQCGHRGACAPRHRPLSAGARLCLAVPHASCPTPLQLFCVPFVPPRCLCRRRRR